MAWLTRDAEVLASVVRWADAPWGALEGALLLDGPALVHSLRSGASLDVAWCRHCDAGLKVQRIAALGPRRLARPCGTNGAVVAAASGAFERWRLAVGDLLEVQGW